MADRSYGLAGGNGVAHEIDHGVAHPHAIWSMAAGNDDSVEVLRARLTRGEIGADLRATLAGVGTSGEGRDEHDLDGRAAQRGE